MLRQIKKQRGTVTLTEMILALAILAWLLAAAYAYLNYGLTAWNKIDDQQYMQSYARLAEDLIRRELRYAYEVKTQGSIPGPTEAAEGFIYMALVRGENYPGQEPGWLILRRTQEGDSWVPAGPVDSIAFDLIVDGDDVTLVATIGASVGSQDYDLSSHVLLLNATHGVDTGHSVVAYRRAP